ncbi:hypothetical protein P6U16_22345 (plasmid) [Rhizobium sp. 32-5/1]|uniref:hypothetical protein n=1 Tax=Rhizobium sp. 32-5/1 TaxID=3019602 RepID=UPI00240E3EDE|nr:hypothetical protein [Rhizobium sp. 32-5/1]WEZ86130.1 hypothetical protein P6U16_22345 [Rhizobium sp. 32-5/1]
MRFIKERRGGKHYVCEGFGIFISRSNLHRLALVEDGQILRIAFGNDQNKRLVKHRVFRSAPRQIMKCERVSPCPLAAGSIRTRTSSRTHNFSKARRSIRGGFCSHSVCPSLPTTSPQTGVKEARGTRSNQPILVHPEQSDQQEL